MRILLAIDESPHSRAALEQVLRLGWPEHTEVLVLSAVRMPVPAYSPHVPATLRPSDYEHDEIEHQELTAHAELALRDAGFRTRARTVHGDPREVIVKAATDGAVDLIVMGSHGRTGLEKMLLGSVASYVVSHAPCSVMVVKLPGWKKG